VGLGRLRGLGCYIWYLELTLAVSWTRGGSDARAWCACAWAQHGHGMAHAPALNARTWPREGIMVGVPDRVSRFGIRRRRRILRGVIITFRLWAKLQLGGATVTARVGCSSSCSCGRCSDKRWAEFGYCSRTVLWLGHCPREYCSIMEYYATRGFSTKL
jgi:hypothetical protein